ncbi:uncharacterized protein LOC129599523 [Paramacrobiotus metropolitanus]|uniref:uncharacterized protein LOC129599523 n=1 Tax=Paramacrobiotus metropolitanus TaxID=2943436 RepID=UPI0024460F9A|nr:uncharacterized protein LOC129599523 [Paramacrobiotus metropolitanus]
MYRTFLANYKIEAQTYYLCNGIYYTYAYPGCAYNYYNNFYNNYAYSSLTYPYTGTYYLCNGVYYTYPYPGCTYNNVFSNVNTNTVVNPVIATPVIATPTVNTAFNTASLPGRSCFTGWSVANCPNRIHGTPSAGSAGTYTGQATPALSVMYHQQHLSRTLNDF